MNNLNPIGTGTYLPNQFTKEDYSFVPPPPSVAGPQTADTSTFDDAVNDPIPANRPQIVDLSKMHGKAYTGCYWWRIALNFNNHGYKQVGRYSQVNGKRASGALQSQQPWVLCLPTLTTVQGAATPPSNASDRCASASFIGQHVFSVYTAGTAMIFKPTSGSNPAVIQQPGYAPPAGVSGILAIRNILVNGTSYLAICFAASGGGNTVQILSDLNNPPTSATIPVGANPTYDLIQTAIDGNALLIYRGDGAGNGEIVAIRTDVGAGAVAVSAPRCKIAPGGYGVGLSEADGEGIGAYWITPQDASVMFFNLGGGTFKGDLMKTDARGYLPQKLDIPLRWVTHATLWRGGIVICDGFTHWYLNYKNPRGKWRRMPVLDDFAPNSDYRTVCCGHHQKNGKFLCEVNDVSNPISSVNSYRYAVEFDYDSWASTQVEVKQVSGAAAGVVISIGGANLPWSPFTNYKYVRAETDTQWHYQQIFPLGTDLFDLRKTAGATAGTGDAEYAANESLTWPAMDIDGLEDCAKCVTAIMGPKPDAVSQGGGAGTSAEVRVEELLSGLTLTNNLAARFYNSEPAQRAQKQEYKWYNEPPWTYQIQPRVTLLRATTGTDPTHLTPNGFNNQIFIEGIAVKDPINAPVAQLLKMMDRQKLEQ